MVESNNLSYASEMLWQLADILIEVLEFWNGAQICLDQYDMTRGKLCAW